MSTEEKFVTEVPGSLKQLARLVVRGFYTIEDTLIVDMLVRNPCKYLLNLGNSLIIIILLI
jgi:transcription initiation factor TFIIE subunit alpha